MKTREVNLKVGEYMCQYAKEIIILFNWNGTDIENCIKSFNG